VPLPSVREAEQWFVDAARAAVEAGERLDDAATELVMALAPHETFIATAIEHVEPASEEHGLAALAHHVSAALREPGTSAAEAGEAVTALEERILPAYIPGRGVGRIADDVAVAHAMADAHQYGRDETHLMMAEELMLSVVRRYWANLSAQPLPVVCEAAVVLEALARQAEKPEYRERAIEALESVSGRYQDLGWRAAPFVLALRVIR
jgi:hypothetical protein